MNNTAPYIPPNTTLDTNYIINTSNFNYQEINSFNEKVALCGVCEKNINKENIPYCSVTNTPLSIAATNSSCPIGKW